MREFLDLRRLLSGAKGLLIMILAPTIIILCFGVSLSQNFFTGNLETFTVAIENLDEQNTLTSELISGLIENENTRGLMKIVPKDELNHDELENVCATIVIPSGFQEGLMSGKTVEMFVNYNPDMPLKAGLVSGIVNSAVDLINTAQAGVSEIYQTLYNNGYTDTASDVYFKTANEMFLIAFNRSLMFETGSELSPLGQLIPIEYYAIALIVIFMILGAMPVCALCNNDIPTLPMHFLAGRNISGFVFSKISSGMAYLFLLALPAAMCCLPIAAGLYSLNNIPAFLFGLVLSCAMISSFAVFISTFAKNNDASVRIYFLISAVIIIGGGLVVPASFFGMFADTLRLTPGAISMRLLSYIFFNDNSYHIYIILTAMYTLIFILLSFIRFGRIKNV